MQWEQYHSSWLLTRYSEYSAHRVIHFKWYIISHKAHWILLACLNMPLKQIIHLSIFILGLKNIYMKKVWHCFGDILADSGYYDIMIFCCIYTIQNQCWEWKQGAWLINKIERKKIKMDCHVMEDDNCFAWDHVFQDWNFVWVVQWLLRQASWPDQVIIYK